MRQILERRFKRVAISNELQPSKYELIAILRKLPDDAQIVRTFDDYLQQTHGFVAWSQDWDIVPIGQEIPYYETWVSYDDLKAARAMITGAETLPTPPPVDWREKVKPQGACICDLAYTGNRFHNRNCPQA